MEKLKLNVRDLLWSVSLIGTAVALFVIALRSDGAGGFLGVLSPTFLGAGLGALEQRKGDGLFWGVLVTVGLAVIAVFLPAIRAARE